MMDKPVLDPDNLIILCDECGSIMNYKIYGSKMMEVYECPGCDNTILKKDLQPEQIQSQKITLGKEKLTLELKIHAEDIEIFQKYNIDISKGTTLILKDLASSLKKADSVYKAFSTLDRNELIKKILALNEEEDQHLKEVNKKSLEASKKMIENRERVKVSKTTY